VLTYDAGVYTYPISFIVPGNAPPTIDCAYGNVSWRLKAQVHRPGTFSQKLTASREVILIASPGEDDTEETENIIVERQWDSQLQYLISISGRCFYIGGTLPIQINMLPMTKMRVHRISVILEGMCLCVGTCVYFLTFICR
jgi:arrestin-related trafficking adapter 3/6